jgi:hypothetical protein
VDEDVLAFRPDDESESLAGVEPLDLPFDVLEYL